MEIEAEFRKEKKTKTFTVKEIIEPERTKPIIIRLAVGDIECAQTAS